MTRHVVKFRGITPFTPKLYLQDLRYFESRFWPPCKKNVRWPRSSLGCAV